MLGADLVWALAAVATERAEFAVLYLASGPTVHALNGRWPASAGSLGLRVGLPLVLGGLGAVSAGDCSRTTLSGEKESDLGCALVPLVMGVLGAGVAITLDATALSWKPVRPPTAAPALAPHLTLRRGFASAGVGGRF